MTLAAFSRLKLSSFATALALLLCLEPAKVDAAVTVDSEIRGSNRNLNLTWVSVKLTNPMSRPLQGVLEFQSYVYRVGQSRAVLELSPVPPGATRHLNVGVPLSELKQGILKEANGDVTSLNLNTSYWSGSTQPFLFASEQSQRPTDNEMDTFTYRMMPADARLHSTGHTSTGSGTTSRTLSPAERIVTHTPLTELPENWLCYIPLTYVIMQESDERRLTAPQRQALDTWLSSGGTLILFNSRTEGESEVVQHGTIMHVGPNPLVDPDFKANIHTDPFPLGSRVLASGTPFREETAGGRGGAFLLATLFLVVAGPINYFFFSRRGEIRKLIVTVPLISVGFCSLIGAYFVVTQGFNRKGGSISVTTVNEQTNRAVTHAKHSLLSGLYPMGGFHFGQETFFVPRLDESYEAADFNITRERVLRGGYFKPGIVFDYATITPYTTRERMLYDAEKATLRNGFELPVKAVAVLHDGTYYTGGAAAPGAEVKVKAVDAASLPLTTETTIPSEKVQVQLLVYTLGQQILGTAERDAAMSLAGETVALNRETSGTFYAAIYEGIPATSDAGVTITDGNNLHIVVGKAGNGEDQP